MNFTKNFTPSENSQMKLSVTVPQDEVKKHYAALTGKYAKQLHIPGFRKGKVPVKILEQKFGESLRAETFNTIIESALEEIFSQTDKYESPLPYSRPAFEDEKEFTLDSDLSFTVVYDVFPKVAVEKTDGFTIEVPQITISEQNIQEELVAIQERNALVVDCGADVPLAIGNIATINFAELDEHDAEIESTARKDFVFTLGKGQLFYEIDDDLLGMKINEEKVITKTYTPDFIDTRLAGKTKKIKVVLTALKERKLPEIDDELAQDVSEKYHTLADLKDAVKKSLTLRIDDAVENRKINSLLKQIAEANPIVLPASMVNAELESRWMMMADQFRISPDQLERLSAALDKSKTKAAMLEEWRPEAELRIKTGLIVETLMQEYGITAVPAEVDAEYESLAKKYDSSVDEIKKHYEDSPKEKKYLIDSIKEKKLYDKLFEKSVIKMGETVTFEEYFDKGNDNAGKNA